MLASLLSLALIHSNCNFIRADNGWDFHKQQESVWTLRRGGVWLLQSFGRFEMWKWVTLQACRRLPTQYEVKTGLAAFSLCRNRLGEKPPPTCVCVLFR